MHASSVGTPPTELAIKQGTGLERWSGRCCPALAPTAVVTQRATDMATGAQAAWRLQQQLDSFTASDVFLGRFEILGRHHRRRGGAVKFTLALRHTLQLPCTQPLPVALVRQLCWFGGCVLELLADATVLLVLSSLSL